MSYQEKKALVFLISNVLSLGFYSLYVFNKYNDIILNTPNDFHFWAKTFFIFIPVSIAGCIIVFIIFNIINKIVTNETIPFISDERDKLIELKAIRISQWIFILGFILTMGSQLIGMQPYVMFLTLIGSCFVSSCVSEISKFIMYRKGV